MKKEAIKNTLCGIAQISLAIGAVVATCALSYVGGTHVIGNAENIFPKLRF